MNPLETFQCTKRNLLPAVLGMHDIKLHHLIAVTISRIGNGNSDPGCITGMSFIHTLHIRIGESGITQAISKRITRFPFKVAVSTSKHRIVLERRQIIVTFIGCQRHASCRIAMPKEHIDNGISRCLSAIPCLKQRIGILAFPLKTHYRARHIDYNQRTSGFLQFFQQLNLHQGKLHSGAVSAGKPSIACCSGISGFTFIIGTYTTHKNNNVRLRGFMSYLYE